MKLAKIKILYSKIRVLSFEKFTAVWDALLYYFGIRVSFKNPIDLSKKLILLLGEQLPPRIPRISKYLKKDFGFQTFLICERNGFVKGFAENQFDEIVLFRNSFHLKRILKSLNNAYLIHGFAPKSRFCAEALKHSTIPYIHDMQDVLKLYYENRDCPDWVKNELPFEKYCLENAAGVVGQSIEPNVASRLYGIHKKPKNIYFPLYCDEEQFQNNSNTCLSEISVVYAGGVSGSHRNPKTHGNTQFFDLAEKLSKQQIHFHIYPSPSLLKVDYEEYEKLQDSNPYFHYHLPVPQSDLSRELSQYHFGILPFFSNGSDQSDLKYKYATTLKLFNYFEAGLPIIVSNDLTYQSWMITKPKCGIGISKNDLNILRTKIESETDYVVLKANVLSYRTKIGLKQNMPRLIRFYEEIIKCSNKI